MEVDGDVHHASATGVRDEHEIHVPLDCETGHTINKRYTCSPTGLKHMDYQSLSKKETENAVSVVYVLKALFLVLTWYTFSLFLTL